jgi:acyl carrier protein
MTVEVLDLVKSVVSEMGQELGYSNLANPSADTPIFGGDAGIDSLSLVQLVAQLERSASEQFGKAIVLADSRAMSRRSSPFRTVGTLAELLQERIAE